MFAQQYEHLKSQYEVLNNQLAVSQEKVKTFKQQKNQNKAKIAKLIDEIHQIQNEKKDIENKWKVKLQSAQDKMQQLKAELQSKKHQESSFRFNQENFNTQKINEILNKLHDIQMTQIKQSKHLKELASFQATVRHEITGEAKRDLMKCILGFIIMFFFCSVLLFWFMSNTMNMIGDEYEQRLKKFGDEYQLRLETFGEQFETKFDHSLNIVINKFRQELYSMQRKYVVSMDNVLEIREEEWNKLSETLRDIIINSTVAFAELLGEATDNYKMAIKRVENEQWKLLNTTVQKVVGDGINGLYQNAVENLNSSLYEESECEHDVEEQIQICVGDQAPFVSKNIFGLDYVNPFNNIVHWNNQSMEKFCDDSNYDSVCNRSATKENVEVFKRKIVYLRDWASQNHLIYINDTQLHHMLSF